MENKTEEKAKPGKKKLSRVVLDKKPYYIIVALFVFAGMGLGYLYYSQIACTTGACSLQSSPYFSILWGGLLGYLIPDLFVKKKAAS